MLRLLLVGTIVLCLTTGSWAAKIKLTPGPTEGEAATEPLYARTTPIPTTDPEHDRDSHISVRFVCEGEGALPRWGVQNADDANEDHFLVPLTEIACDKIAYYFNITTTARYRVLVYESQATVTFYNRNGYLSAMHYPMLVFYSIFAFVYLFLAILWAIVNVWHWRELMRLQFLVSLVILLGMISMAFFYGDLSHFNTFGTRNGPLMVAANFMYSVKKTFARLLVLVVSMGYGIVKPTFGENAKSLILFGLAYFLVSFGFDVSQSLDRQYADPEMKRINVFFLVPVFILNATLVFWTFSSIHKTMKQLQMRRQELKLGLYKKFAYILMGSVVVSMIFMICFYPYVIKYKESAWPVIWLEEAFWHVLFFVILCAICVLWRPVVNNVRYTYAVVDGEDPEDDDDRRGNTLHENLGDIKLRTRSRSNSVSGESPDDLRWVEENIPSSITKSDLPTDILNDSDEDVMDTKLELSKMN